MSIANSFPIFEADQVLTNNHLNDLFNYLDQQDRITRSKLLGSGIVCGLEISYSNNAINITKGCGLTSQGYTILFCDHVGVGAYKYYVPYTRPAFPGHLQLIIQCGNEPDHTKIPFFAGTDKSTENSPDSNIQLLLTQDDYNNLADNTVAVALSQIDLSNYAVVLFLDADELSLKNCDTNDCNDKGSRMDFEIKPLLVNVKALNGSGGKNAKPFQSVELRRYNVPVKNLNTANDVLNAFVALLDAQTLERLSADLRSCYDQYSYLLTGNGTAPNPFGTAADFNNDIKFIMKNQPFLIQYYYDFIYDLINAFYEFRHKAYSIVGECCGDEMKFPFHLVLGEADVATGSNGLSALRQYFIYSPLFDAQGAKADELRSLLMRMILLYQDFALRIKSSDKKNNFSLPQAQKITPSNYGSNYISERCIPYYYKVVHDSTDKFPQDLYYYWNYEKTKRGNARFNLCYDPTPYNNADSIVNPLYYDVEWHNFFRIEGHIGKSINTALTDVVTIQQNLNLPFDVVALSADYIGALLAGKDPVCCIQDLDADYRIMIAEFVCELHDVFCYVARRSFTPPTKILLEREFFSVDTAGKSTKSTTTKKSAASLKASASLLSKNGINIAADHPFVSSLVNEFQATASYTKGDTLSRLCGIAADASNKSIGSYYLVNVNANNGSFANPLSSSETVDIDALNYYLLEFVDAVESMFQMLMTTDLSALDTTAFKKLYSNYEAIVNSANIKALASIEKLELRETEGVDYVISYYVEKVQVILQTCIVEKLDALKNEYLRRIAQYRLAKNFNYYFKKHGGIEHKAGVPRGGTFILVYHEERKKRNIDVRSMFINQDLSNVLLSNFQELLKPDVDLDTQEAKTKMLAVSLMYNEPSLYLQYKNVMQQYLDDCTNLPPDKKTQITEILNQPPTKQTFTLTDGAVIADFYVPYMCCSDCPPIAYILPTKDEPTFDIQPRKFLYDDAHNYSFESLPAVTSIDDVKNTGNLKLMMDGDKLYLHPAMDPLPVMPAIVSYNGIDVPITIIKPDASFTVNVTSSSNPTEGEAMVEVIAANTDADLGGYLWEIRNPDEPSSPVNSNLFAAVPAPQKVTLPALLKAANGKNSLIELTITYTLNNNKSTDTQKVLLKNGQLGTFKSSPEDDAADDNDSTDALHETVKKSQTASVKPSLEKAATESHKSTPAEKETVKKSHSESVKPTEKNYPSGKRKKGNDKNKKPRG